MDIVMNESLINSFDITLDYVYGEAKRAYEEDIFVSHLSVSQRQCDQKLKR